MPSLIYEKFKFAGSIFFAPIKSGLCISKAVISRRSEELNSQLGDLDQHTEEIINKSNKYNASGADSGENVDSKIENSDGKRKEWNDTSTTKPTFTQKN